MKKIVLKKIVVPKDDFSKLENSQKRKYIMLCAIVRDLNLLQKMLLYTCNMQASNDAEDSAKETMTAFFLKTLMSKIHESYIFINDSGIKKEYADFSDDLKDKIQKIDSFFLDKKTKNIFYFIRNKFGFHYEAEDTIDGLIENSLDNNDFEMWLSTNNAANEFFPSLDKATLNVINMQMRELGFSGGNQELFNKLFELTTIVTPILREFCIVYLTEAFHFTFEEKESVQVNAVSFSEIPLTLISE